MKDLLQLRKEKLKDVDLPLIISMNKKNFEYDFELISNHLIDLNFEYVKNCDDESWDHHLFDCNNVELSFEELKKLTNKKFPQIEMQVNTHYMECLKGTKFKVTPTENKLFLNVMSYGFLLKVNRLLKIKIKI